MPTTALIFMKLTGLFLQRPHSDIFRTEFHSERSMNSDMTGINLFTPLIKVRHCDYLYKTHALSTDFVKNWHIGLQNFIKIQQMV